MTVESVRKLRDDPNEDPELRFALRDAAAELPSNADLRRLETSVRLRAELGEPPRLIADDAELPDEYCAGLFDSNAELPNCDQLDRLKKAVEERLEAELPNLPMKVQPRRSRRRSRGRLVVLGLSIPALAAASVAGYYLAGVPSARVATERSKGPAPSESARGSLETSSSTLRERAAGTAPSAGLASTSLPKVKVPSKTPRSNLPIVEDEYALLREAQSSRGTSPTESLRLLTVHEKLFPNGALSEERERLAVECLLKVGRVDEAVRRAERFHSTFPSSVHWPALQGLLSRHEQRLDER
jgi:hypothetical protein